MEKQQRRELPASFFQTETHSTQAHHHQRPLAKTCGHADQACFICMTTIDQPINTTCAR